MKKPTQSEQYYADLWLSLAAAPLMNPVLMNRAQQIMTAAVRRGGQAAITNALCDIRDLAANEALQAAVAESN